jgi:hypothetical protein
MWQKLKPKKPNIAIEQISKPSVAIVVDAHFELDTTIIEVNNQMAVIQVQVGKNIVEDVLINGRTSVNIIIKNLITKLGLPKPRPTPYHFRMANQNMTKPLRIIKKLKIHIHGIPYIATFIILKNSVVDSSYSMLLGRPWLKDAKITHD